MWVLNLFVEDMNARFKGLNVVEKRLLLTVRIEMLCQSKFERVGSPRVVSQAWALGRGGVCDSGD